MITLPLYAYDFSYGVCNQLMIVASEYTQTNRRLFSL